MAALQIILHILVGIEHRVYSEFEKMSVSVKLMPKWYISVSVQGHLEV